MVCCDGNGFCNNGFIPIGNVVRHGDKDLVYEDVSKSDDGNFYHQGTFKILYDNW